MFSKKDKKKESEAVEVLERRNAGLESELAAAQQEANELLDRVTAAEGTLVTFHATLEQMGALLSLAEERAKQIEESANAEAAVVRAEADARVREAEAEVAAVVERKQEALATLAALRTSLVEVAPVPAPELAPARVTVADLMALDANSGISA
jgi:chromosome segregation ATPase